MHLRILITLLLLPVLANAQLAGRSVYNFLNLPVSARATALGGSAYAMNTNDPGLVLSNPSLMNPEMGQQVVFNTGFYLAGTNYGALAYTHYVESAKTSFVGGVQYVSFGKFDGRDPAGNAVGDFRAGDVSLNGGFSRQWKKFSYGAQLKFIFSSIEQYNSFGIATDWSATYYSKEKEFSAALTLRNLGAQLSTYVEGADRESLPLDLSLAISKRFEKLPLRINVVAHNLQTWDLTYPEQSNNNLLINSGTKERGFMDKLFAHVIFGAEVDAGKYIRIRAGYNHLNRQALANSEKKGFTGMSAGLGLVLQQFRVDYSFSKYSAVGALNHIGLTINLKEWGNKTN